MARFFFYMASKIIQQLPGFILVSEETDINQGHTVETFKRAGAASIQLRQKSISVSFCASEFL